MRPFGSPTATDTDYEEENAKRRRFIARLKKQRGVVAVSSSSRFNDEQPNDVRIPTPQVHCQQAQVELAPSFSSGQEDLLPLNVPLPEPFCSRSKLNCSLVPTPQVHCQQAQVELAPSFSSGQEDLLPLNVPLPEPFCSRSKLNCSLVPTPQVHCQQAQVELARSFSSGQEDLLPLNVPLPEPFCSRSSIESNSSDKLIIRGGDGTHHSISSFQEMNLPPVLLKNLNEMGITEPTPIQCVTLPLIMRKFEFDIIAEAATGCGKTVAYLLPIISLINSWKSTNARHVPMNPYAIILVPTRELAIQVSTEANKLVKNLQVTVAVTYGEMKQNKTNADLKSGCDIVIGTAGRLASHLSGHSLLRICLKKLNWIVIDEADHFYERDRQNEIDYLLNFLRKSQRRLRLYLFSATFDTIIVEKFKKHMSSLPFEIVDREVAKGIEYEWKELHLTQKIGELLKDLYDIKEANDGQMPKTIVFANEKRRCKYLAIHLRLMGFNVALLYGECCQSTREQTLNDFRSGKINLLVGTNLVARGLDIPNVKFVINFDFPCDNISIFIHRVGRTGRAGHQGHVINYNGDESLIKLITGTSDHHI